MKVRDFKNGLKVAGATFIWSLLISIATLYIAGDLTNEAFIFKTIFFISLFFIVILPIIGFIVNYTPLSVEDGIVTIPASDQIRTFLDFITINPITGLYRRRKYSVKDIQNVANGYTRPGRGTKNRTWNVVITGVNNGKSFSQRIDVSNKQVRDEVRNVLKQTISGKVNSEFSY